jgi:hypothetical protein
MSSSTQWSAADHRLQLGSRAGSASEDGVDAAEIEEEGRDDETHATRRIRRGATTANNENGSPTLSQAKAISMHG